MAIPGYARAMPKDPHPELRPADASDSGDLLAWRNDPETRANSRSTGPVDAATHHAWLTHALADPNRRLWVAEAGGAKVGTLSVVRLDDGRAEFSITVAPTWRGRGIGVAMLRVGVAESRRLWPGAPLLAWIRSTNTASCRLFERCGFRLLGEEAEFRRYGVEP